MPAIVITVLGSGTSMGVPTIGCDCKVCTSADPRDNRLRPSVMVQYQGHTVLIDTTPDFRQQALQQKIKRVDAILYTHAHADHIMGLDDIRPISLKRGQPIPIYGSTDTLDTLRRTFSYAFENAVTESTVPKIESHVIEVNGSVDLFGVQFQSLVLHHGRGFVFGYRFGNAAYLTDHSEIPPEAMAKLTGLDVLFLDALRHKPHPTHTTLQGAVKIAEELQPRRTFLTHLSHDLPHEYTESTLPDNVRLAYDGLRIEVRETV